LRSSTCPLTSTSTAADVESETEGKGVQLAEEGEGLEREGIQVEEMEDEGIPTGM
jgi:hypothetical protein